MDLGSHRNIVWPVWKVVIASALAIGATEALADTPPVQRNDAPLPIGNESLVGFFSARTPYEFWLTVLIAVTGILIITIMVRAVRGMPGAQPADITRSAIVVTIVIGTLILITAGYSNTQIAPAFGLFGTIIGYIIGRMSNQQAVDPPSTGTLDTNAQAPAVGGNAAGKTS